MLIIKILYNINKQFINPINGSYHCECIIAAISLCVNKSLINQSISLCQTEIIQQSETGRSRAQIDAISVHKTLMK